MSKQKYNWERFWCSRSNSIELDYSGYLPEPNLGWERACNPEIIGLTDFVDLPCLILLGEAGIGKTTAIEAAHRQVYEQTKNLEDVCLPLFRLGEYGSDTELCTAIFRSNTFREWLSGSHKLYLFLDSLDEGLLSIKNLVRILKREIKDLPCDRLYFRLTCRTAEWASSFEEKLIEKWGEDSVRAYTLAPLRRQDVIEAAIKNNIIDVEDFLQVISDRNAVPLAIKPITLKFLINIYNKERKLPSSQIELYEEGCLQLCEEVNPDRLEAGEKGKLSSEKRMLIAGRIAAVMLFCGRSAVWTSPEHGKKDDFDIAIQDLCKYQEQADGQEFNVEDDYIREVFKVTGLFSEQDCNQRIAFSHRNYAEFLAAWYLTQHKLKLSQILSLIIHPDGRVIPQLQETAAWSAGMMPEVFQEIMKTDPDLLLQSDISTTDSENKTQLVASLLKLHDEEKLEYFRFRHYKKLDYPGLPGQLESYICDLTKSQWSRLVAIDIARHCETKAVQDSLADIALDPTQAYIVRENAAQTICVMGDEKSKARLKPLALGEVCNDPEDYLKGHALKATFPQHLTIEELLDNITQPKSQSIGGTYADFIASGVAERLHIQDISVMLRWLTEKLPRRYSLGYPFQQLSDSVMLKAWQSCDEPDVLEAFANVAICRLKKHEGILGDPPIFSSTLDNCNDDRDDNIEPILKNCNAKRRQLIEEIVSLSSESEEDCSWLVQIIASEDIFWIIENASSSESDRDSTTWAKLSSVSLNYHSLRWKEARYVDAILQACGVSSAMKTEFEDDVTSLELGSERAKQVESTYLKYQIQLPKQESLVDPQLKQRVLRVLQRVETGQPHLWWQVVAEMTLVSNSEEYSHHKIFKADITKLPGWEEAEADTKARIIEAAKNYLNAGDPETQVWISTNNFSHPPFAGYQALYLIAKEESGFISIIPCDTWLKWMPVILKSISYTDRSETGKDEISSKLVRSTYKSSPDKFIEILITLMRQNNYQPQNLYSDDVYRLTRELLDQCLANPILDKILDKDLNAGLLEILLKDLFKDDIDKAKALATSFIPTKLPESKDLRDKAVVAARLLIVHPDNSSWVKFWSLVEQNHEFGKEVLEAISLQAIREGQIEQKINEDYLANLYMFLAQQYSEIDQPEPETQELEGIEAQIGSEANDIRMWKNYIPQRLQARGTPEACDAMRKIIRELPEQEEQLKPRLLETESLVRRNTWEPPTSKNILQIVLDRDKRLVKDGMHLLNVLLESLKRLEFELQGETPAAIFLWDSTSKKKFKPKDENDFSNYVKLFLDRDLKSRGVIVNREVELRRNYGGQSGERTDIHVDAVLKHANGEVYDSITAIIEVKGCWHKEVKTAMERQLVERYLADNSCPYGLYLVGWFNCQQWDSKDTREKQAPKITLSKARKLFDDQAQHLTSADNIVQAYVLDTALR